MTAKDQSFAIVAILSLALGQGCGGSRISPPRTFPVKGTVTLEGVPTAGILVKFHPQFNIGKIKYIPLGETGQEGEFTLSTGAGGNGAPRGEYLVTFERPKIVSDRKNSGIELEVDDLKGAYSDPAKSQWKVVVNKGENQLEPFRLN